MATADETRRPPQQTAETAANAVLDGGSQLGVRRYFTIPGRDPFDEVEWETRDAFIPGKEKPAFDQKGVEFPKIWSQTATNIVAQKYFRGRMSSPDRERSVKQMIGRVVDDDRHVGPRRAATSRATRRRETFEDELKFILLHQLAAFNSPVWFNVGFEEKPQCSACFILSIDDSMDSILDWIRREGVIFRGGSGSGVNLSKLRSSKEQLSKGGYASGPGLVHARRRRLRRHDQVRRQDAARGEDGRPRRRPSGRRGVHLVQGARRRRRRASSRRPATTCRSTAPDWASIQYQNANNSVRVTDAFMEAAADGARVEPHRAHRRHGRRDGRGEEAPARDRRGGVEVRRPGRAVRHDDQQVAHAAEHVAHQRVEPVQRVHVDRRLARATSRR